MKSKDNKEVELVSFSFSSGNRILTTDGKDMYIEGEVSYKSDTYESCVLVLSRPLWEKAFKKFLKGKESYFVKNKDGFKCAGVDSNYVDEFVLVGDWNSGEDSKKIPMFKAIKISSEMEHG